MDNPGETKGLYIIPLARPARRTEDSLLHASSSFRGTRKSTITSLLLPEFFCRVLCYAQLNSKICVKSAGLHAWFFFVGFVMFEMKAKAVTMIEKARNNWAWTVPKLVTHKKHKLIHTNNTRLTKKLIQTSWRFQTNFAVYLSCGAMYGMMTCMGCRGLQACLLLLNPVSVCLCGRWLILDLSKVDILTNPSSSPCLHCRGKTKLKRFSSCKGQTDRGPLRLVYSKHVFMSLCNHPASEDSCKDTYIHVVALVLQQT